jgi:hypothetical protein
MSVASANASLMTLGAGWDNRSASGMPSPSRLIRKSSQSGTSGMFDDAGKKTSLVIYCKFSFHSDPK